jgi:hypothetical protein
MRRRALLANAASSASVALAVGTAGCLTTDGESTTATLNAGGTDTRTAADDGDGTATESTTTAEAPTEVGPGDAVTVAGVDLDLGTPSLQLSFVEHHWPTWDARAPDDGLYAVLPVTPSEAAPFLSDDPPLWATVDGDRWSDGGPTVAAMNAEDHPERFAVPVPTGSDAADVEDVAIALGGTNGTVHYPLDDDRLVTLRDPPDLAATATFPDETESRYAVEFALTIENTGGSTGTLAVATTHDNIHDKYWTHRVTAAPGRTTTETFSIHPHAGPGETVETTVDWGLDTRTATVTVGDSTTTPDDDRKSIT